jgi:macrophage erythroblast attacher
MVLQAGLAALKVPQSLEEGTNKEDPLHLDDFRRLASALPFSKHVHSKLVCAITRAPMNEHNPPMVRRA